MTLFKTPMFQLLCLRDRSTSNIVSPTIVGSTHSISSSSCLLIVRPLLFSVLSSLVNKSIYGYCRHYSRWFFPGNTLFVNVLPNCVSVPVLSLRFSLPNPYFKFTKKYKTRVRGKYPNRRFLSGVEWIL